LFTGLSKTIQNELLDSILAVTQDLIQKEIAANETTDNANITQMDIDSNKKVLGTIQIDPSVPLPSNLVTSRHWLIKYNLKSPNLSLDEV
jgi:hypothetical protein